MRRQRVIFVMILVVFVGAANAFAQITKDEALSKFVSAGMAYQNGEYDTAIAKYNEILSGGRESGAVYYNLGNSYFRAGDIGRAVLNYERAKRLIPRDSGLNFNERYVRARVDRSDADTDKKVFGQIADNFISFYTVSEMTLILTLAAVIAASIFLLSLYMGWTKSTVKLIVAVLLFISAVYTFGLGVKIASERDAAVVVAEAKAFFEPRDDSTVHFKLPEGTKARILRAEGMWLKAQRMDGRVGWVTRDALEKI